MEKKTLTMKTKSPYLRGRYGSKFELTIEGTDKEVLKRNWHSMWHTDNACMMYILREKFECLPRRGLVYCCTIKGKCELLHETELEVI